MERRFGSYGNAILSAPRGESINRGEAGAGLDHGLPARVAALGALHALTPGHGKAALAAYFLGQDAKIGTSTRLALAAALLHVVMGALAFVVLRFVLSWTPLMTGRGSPVFAVLGYGLIVLAGIIMVIQSLRPIPAAAHRHVLTLGVGLLPCPLTISVLGFAWAQGVGAMVALVLIALAAGIAFTIGTVALIAMTMRRVVARHLSSFDRWGRALQGFAGAMIVAIGTYSLWIAM